ncbi:hypothetical protein CAEBREN_25110 [Caenorhabditis brenneri]|uniref:SCP domain-containing protein n=1 Tax=Caenorhabditis brenneri TaxID=135651 RepID=G0MQD7_CAEBE|nr:hypothetical protein CAEBREN_25110 [Caenorhabditis brenneri]
MKLLTLIVLVCIHEITCAKDDKIPHQGRFFLRNVNEARKYLASGLLRQLEPLGLGVIKLPPVGPAANMFRIKWSKELETIAEKNVKGGSLKGPCGNFKQEGYSGFYWENDLVAAMKRYIAGLNISGLSFPTIEKVLKKFSSAFETLLFIVWAIISYPKQFPIPDDAQIGPAEALYAHRFEIGCAFDEFAICVMRDTKNNGTLYKEGVACTQCPTHCEFTENIDGTIEEGDLCVPPEPGSELNSQMQLTAELKEMQDFIDSGNTSFSMMGVIFVFVIYVLVFL